MDNQIYVSQLSVSLFFYELSFKVKKIDLRLKKTLKLKFKLIFFNSSIRHVFATPCLSIQFTFLSYWWKDYSNGLGSYLAALSYGQQNLPQNCLAFYFVRQKSCFFIPSFRHQDSNSYYSVFLMKNSQKFENVRLLASFFRYANLMIVPLIASELFNRNFSIVHPTLYFNFVIASKLQKKNHMHKMHNTSSISYQSICLIKVNVKKNDNNSNNK